MAPKGSIVVLIAEVPKPPAPVEVTVPNVVGVEVTKAVVTLQAADLKVADNSGGPIPSTGTVTGIDPAVGAKVAKGSTVVIAVKAPTATVAPPPPASPPAPVVKVPEPSPSPVAPPTGKPAVMVYVQETLTAEFASKLGLPPGTILFIPHKVEGA
jgi:beta-lactam-binding protein with PASTA domain